MPIIGCVLGRFGPHGPFVSWFEMLGALEDCKGGRRVNCEKRVEIL